VATLTPPRPVTIYSGGDVSNRTFTVYGTDRVNAPMTEVITGPNATTVQGNKIFKTVTRIAISGAAGAAVEVGWDARSYTSWIILANFRGHYMWWLRTFIQTGDTVAYDIEATSKNVMSDFDHPGEYPDDLFALLSAQTGNVQSTNDSAITAIRLKVTAQTGPITMRVNPTRTA
jgi:hypothetical protein